MELFKKMRKVVGTKEKMPKIETIEEAKALFKKRNEACHGAYYDDPVAVFVLKRWEELYRPIIGGSIKSRNFGLFFEAITSLDRPDMRGELFKEAREAIPSMVALITTPEEARVYSEKGTFMREYVNSHWDELSLVEVDSAKTFGECQTALEKARPFSEVFWYGLKKLAGLASKTREIQAIMAYRADGYFCNSFGRWEEVILVIRQRAEAIVFEKIKDMNDIEEVSYYYDLCPENGAGRFLCIERWVDLCKTPQDANDLFKKIPQDNIVCRLKAYKKLAEILETSKDQTH
jgi:hypothetical protein